MIKLTAKTGGNEDIEDIIPNPINGLENKNVLESLFIPLLSDTTTTTAQRHSLRSQSRTNPISTAPSSSSIANPDIPLICSRTSISRRDKCFMCKYYFQHAFSNRETTSEGCKRCGKDFGVQLPICHRTECWKDHLSHIHDPILGLRIRDLINRQRSQIGLSRFEFASKTVQSIYSKSKKRK